MGRVLEEERSARTVTAVDRKGYYALLLFTTFWIALILCSPFLFRIGSVGTGIGVFIRYLFSPICHQDLSRSLTILGIALPVCERCSAIYFSFSISLISFQFIFRKRPYPSMDLSRLTLLLLPMLCDYIFDVFGFWHNSTLSRMTSGSLAGIGFALFIVPAWMTAVRQIFFQKSIHI